MNAPARKLPAFMTVRAILFLSSTRVFAEVLRRMVVT